MQINDLKGIVEKEKRLNKKQESIDVASLKFPAFNEDYIRELTFGVYQLKQAKSYTAEHLDDYGNYKFLFLKLRDDVIHVRINSRHSSHTIHNSFVQFTRNDP